MRRKVGEPGEGGGINSGTVTSKAKTATKPTLDNLAGPVQTKAPKRRGFSSPRRAIRARRAHRARRRVRAVRAVRAASPAVRARPHGTVRAGTSRTGGSARPRRHGVRRVLGACRAAPREEATGGEEGGGNSERVWRMGCLLQVSTEGARTRGAYTPVKMYSVGERSSTKNGSSADWQDWGERRDEGYIRTWPLLYHFT